MNEATDTTNDDIWLTMAKRIDFFRVVPRTILVVYFAFFIKAWMMVFMWFSTFNWTSLPQDQVVGSVAVAAVAGFPALIIGSLTKVLFQLVDGYWNAPRAVRDEA